MEATHPEQTPLLPGQREAAIRRVFRISLWIKGAHSLVEIVSGIALYFVSIDFLVQIARGLTEKELMDDPNDLIANFLMRSAEALSLGQKRAASLYLLSHGIIKLGLVAEVLRERAWAYPAFLIALVLLIAYQSYQIFHHFSVWLFVLTVFDVVILVLTWHEYRLHRRAAVSGS